MRQIMRKSIIIIPIIFFVFCWFLYSFFWTSITIGSFILNGGLQGKTIVHKAINHNQYNIVFVSRVSFDGEFYLPPLIIMYLEIWLDGKKIKSHSLYSMDEDEKYNRRIKNVTLLLDSNEIKIDFHNHEGLGLDDSVNRTGVGLYKIVEDQADNPVNP